MSVSWFNLVMLVLFLKAEAGSVLRQPDFYHQLNAFARVLIEGLVCRVCVCVRGEGQLFLTHLPLDIKPGGGTVNALGASVIIIVTAVSFLSMDF